MTAARLIDLLEKCDPNARVVVLTGGSWEDVKSAVVGRLVPCDAPRPRSYWTDAEEGSSAVFIDFSASSSAT